MKRIGLWPTICLVFGALCITIAGLCITMPGCGQTGNDKGGTDTTRKSGVAAYTAEDLKRDIGEYMPTQRTPDGSLEIAAPRDWVWKRAGSEYLVGFHKKGSSLNNLPRILVSVEDSPFPGLSDVNKENVDQLVKLVSESVDATKLKGAVEPMVLGQTACARYVKLGRKGNARAAIQTLKTVVRGRLYTIRLEAFDGEFTKYRDVGYAVAASMKFSSSGTTPEVTPEVDETTESAEPEVVSPAKDADDPPKPAADDSE
jgi:hypothetical protein